MSSIKSKNLAEAYEKLESGINPDKVLAMFPEEKEEIQKIIYLLASLQKEKFLIEAPKEVLKKILNEKIVSDRATGRSSVLESLKNIISNINFMNSKLKLSLSALVVIVVLAVGIAVFKSNGRNSGVAIDQKTETVGKTKLATTTPVIGNKEVDASVNGALNDVLNEDDLNSELADVDLALSDEAELDQINNLVNDDEL